VQTGLRVCIGNLRILIVRCATPLPCDPTPDDPDPTGQPLPPLTHRYLRVRWVHAPLRHRIPA